MANILIVEDEKLINDLIRKHLSLVGHVCAQAFDGSEALSMLPGDYDLLILDVMLPGVDGFGVKAAAGNIPAIFVTARGSLEDRLRGLRMGADDYIVKPFEMLELSERGEAVLRRCGKSRKTVEFDDVVIDLESRTVRKGGEEVSLKPKEYALLEVLVRNRNLALSRDKLLALVWGYDYEGDSRTVDVHVQQLRQKLGLQERLKTVYKLGYRFEL